MYEKHFNFSDNPFTIAPNPRYLYLTGRHREALAHLTYGLRENGGFILLTGEVGTGKTTVCRCLLERVPDNVHLALVLTPALGVNELLEAICDEFGVAHEKGATTKGLTDALNRYLLDVHAQGQRVVVVIDEAQNLDVAVLEQLRLLTNLETNEQKLLQIILIGQPEFLEQLERPELRQLSQRIVARFHLTPLKAGEVQAYVAHRLKVAGGNASIFPRAVLLRIAQLSKGVPRVINLLCDRALLGCYVQEKHQVDMRTLEQAAREVFGERRAPRRRAGRGWEMQTFRKRRWAMPAAAAIAVVAVGAGVYLQAPALNVERWGAFQRFVAGEAPPAPENAPAILVEPPQAAVSAPAEVAVAKPATEIEPPVAPLTWDSLAQEEHSEAGAYLALFKSWKVDYSAAEAQAPCGFASRNRLDCWHKRGKWRDLERLNRPVLLKMATDEGVVFYAALLGINKGDLRLGLGDREMKVARSEIEKRWTNEFTLLWRRPPGFARTLRPGDKSKFVSWVKERVSQVEGRKVSHRQSSGQSPGQPSGQPSAQSSVYNFALVNRVRNLQRRCGLRVDGLVGRETVIMISGLTSSVPTLSKSSSRRCPRRLNV